MSDNAPRVPFVDFRAHLEGQRAEIDAAVKRVLDSGSFILGPEVSAFEKELAAALEAGDAVAVGNGTDALELCLRAQGVGPGDEVITSTLSAAFTGLAILRTGATPVFADVDPQTLNLDPGAVAGQITTKTKALLPVHLYGHPADLDPLCDLASRYGLIVIEDACQAHGARYNGRTVGAIAGLGALSFYPTKNLGAFGDGGAILVNDPTMAGRLRQLRNGGQSDRCRHDLPGINSRLDELQAAILRVKLGRLPQWLERRRALAAVYFSELAEAGVDLPAEQPYARAVYHLFVIRHPRRDALLTALVERGIQTLIHYPVPLHLQGAFGSLGGKPADCPVAEAACREVLSLPLYPELTEDRVRHVAATVRDLAGRV